MREISVFTLTKLSLRPPTRGWMLPDFSGRGFYACGICPVKSGFRGFPHCSDGRSGFPVADTSIPGRPGTVYEGLPLPFRAVEDVLLLGLLFDGLERM